MELRSVKIDLKVDDEQLQSLWDTAVECKKVFALFTGLSKEHRSTSYSRLHHIGYEKAKELCPTLPTTLLQQVARNACGAVKSFNSNNPKKKWKYVGVVKANTIDLNKLTLSRRGNLTTISTINKRIRVLHEIPEWFLERYDLEPNNIQAGKIKLNKNGKVTLNLMYRVDVKPQRETGEIMGIDRGLYNLCTTSDGETFKSTHIATKRKYQHLRAELQQKGTKSAKRKLKRLSGKEKRFMLDVNHCITKQLANAQGVKIFVLEDLKNIRNLIRKRRRGKKLNSWLSNWSFAEFEFQLDYKCREKGITIEHVNPAYTSQKCSKCGTIDKSARNKSRYICKNCGHRDHADVNAAKNIRDNHIQHLERKLEQAAFNQPNVGQSACPA